eukprot:TRINITY_DN7623_c0_g1_i2.p1 TRINITY_DN7623_c0_g1~~TRINITY_DN7623_c0_g1_i2.p1  ORF type:complete len:446 (+),score=38.86 TRINITY_DN7623_c0_g1_i2:744-2081(+)
MVKNLKPDTMWLPWKFQHVPRNYWKSIDSHHTFLDALMKYHNVHSIPEDCYRIITVQIVYEFGGRTLLRDYYDNSLYNMFKSLYPNYDWEVWRFLPKYSMTTDWTIAPGNIGYIPSKKFQQHPMITADHLNDPDKRRRFLTWAEEVLEIRTSKSNGSETTIEPFDCSKWYKVNLNKFLSLNGTLQFLEYYHQKSVYYMLEEMYPSFEWKCWKFQKFEKYIPSETIFADLSEHLMIEKEGDWLRVSQQQLKYIDAYVIKKRWGNIVKFLQNVFPDKLNFELKVWKHHRKATQRWLYASIRKLFPLDTTVHEDFNLNTYFSSSENDKVSSPLELDIFVPKYNLAFEYQGEQHYSDQHKAFGPSSSMELYGIRDKLKQKYCEQQGITLIHIPYWWDGKLTTLLCTILASRPDLNDTLNQNVLLSTIRNGLTAPIPPAPTLTPIPATVN